MASKVCQFCGQSAQLVGDAAATVPASPAVSQPIGTLVTGLFICETCYRKASFEHWTPEDLYDLHYHFALAFMEVDRANDALASLQRAAGMQENSDVLVLMANHYGETGQHERQITLLKRALKLDPEDFLARRGLISALRDQGRLDQALSLVDEDLSRIGAMPDLLMERAELLMLLNETDAATESYRAACAAAESDEDRMAFETRWARMTGKAN